MDILWLTWLAFPIGVLVALVGRKRRWAILIGGVLCLTAVISALLFREAFVWQFDLIRGWSVRVPVEIDDYEIILIQEPGIDFYDTTLRVVRPDGHEATILLDGDDRKWRNPRVLRDGGRVFIAADNEPREAAPVIDVENETVTVSGWTDGTFRLAELEYKEWPNKPCRRR